MPRHVEIGPTKERLAKVGMVPVYNERGKLVEARSFEWPLDYYERARHISRAQAIAGNRFHGLWRKGSLKCRFAHIRYGDEPFIEEAPADNEAAPVTWEDYVLAVRAMRDERVRLIAYHVCCLGQMAGRGNMDGLRCALEDLRKHFGLRELAAVNIHV